MPGKRWRKPDNEVQPATLVMRKWTETDAGLEYKKRQAANMREWRKNPAKNAMYKATQRRVYDRLRVECFLAYSPPGTMFPSCRCCGEGLLEFLHLDHKASDGAAFRRKFKEDTGRFPGGTVLYYWLKKNNWPDLGLQVLCANCNLGKRAGKYCPHERQRGRDMDGLVIPDQERGKYAGRAVTK